MVHKARSRDGALRIDTKEYVGVVALGVKLYVVSLFPKGMLKIYQLSRCNNDLVRAYFNKQGTKVIVYKDSTRSSFNISLTADKEHEEKSKKTFAGYCEGSGICKGIPVSAGVI